MNKLLASAVILILPLTKLFGQPAELQPPKKPDPLPAAAKATVDRYDKQVAEAKKVFEAKSAEAAETARKELAKLQEQETRAGRLEAALAIKAEIERLPEKAEVPSANQYIELAKRIKEGTFTAEEWNKLSAPKVNVPSNHEQTVTDYVLRKGDIYIVAPCPTDEWNGNGAIGKPTTYLGNNAGFLRLRVMVGDLFMKDKGFVAEGEGKLIFSPYDNDYGDNTGVVRVKILKIR
jgi:hypothetical protein